MNDVIVVQIVHALHDLVHVVPGFRFGEGFAPFVQLHHGSALAQLQHDVDVVSVLEKTVKSHHVIVVQRTVNFDFLGHFLALVLTGHEFF